MKDRVQKDKGGQVCPHARKCGGCQLQNMTYDRQLQWKQALTVRLLGKFQPVEPIVGMEYPYHYRNKVQAAFGTDAGGRMISGVYQSSTHRIVPVERCLLEDETADAIFATIRGLMPRLRIAPYDERTGRGLLRHVLVKRGFASGEVMVVLVTASPILPARRQLVEALRRAHPEITTIIQNINGGRTSLVLGETEHVLAGPGYIEETLCGLRFRISAKSFYQINPVQTEVLYNQAMAYAGLTGRERVIDAYCGTGTIGLIAARAAAAVIGVENNRDAVRDAAANARRNGIGNARFVHADAGAFLSEMAEEGETADVVFVDPPRAGCSGRFLDSLVRLSPQRIVYISCNPETLARDMETLVARGYRAAAIQPVDMFPHTAHVECVVLMSRAVR